MTRSVMTRMPRRVRPRRSARRSRRRCRTRAAPCRSRGCRSRRRVAASRRTAAATGSRRRATADSRAWSVKPAQVAGAVGVGVEERPNQHLVEHRALEPRAILRQGAGVPEVFGGGMFDHAVLDVATFGGIVYRALGDALVHQRSNLPMSGETESSSTPSATMRRASANSTTPRRRRWPTNPSCAPVESTIESGYGFRVLDPSVWRSGHHWRCLYDKESSSRG